jgi:hypothetical protein
VYQLSFGDDIQLGTPTIAKLILNNSILSETTNNGNDLYNNGPNKADGTFITGPSSLVQNFSIFNGPGATNPLSGTPLSIINLSAMLSPLTDNGGLTQTMSPQPGSPAIARATPIASITTDQRGDPRDPTTPTMGAFEPQLVLTTANSATATYNTASQTVKLTASVVAKGGGATITTGSVLFTVKDSQGNTIGTTTSGPLTSSGTATANYTLPAGQAAGSYSVVVTYSDSTGALADGGDTDSTLVINPAPVTVKETDNLALAFTPGPVTLNFSATVTSSGGVVNEGSVTFTLKDPSGTTIGTPQTVSVSAGSATTSYPLTSLGAGSYTIAVSYTDTNPGNFVDGGTDTSGSVTVTGTAVLTTALPATTAASATQQTIALSATLSSNISEGTVNFKVVQGNTTVATGSGSVVGGSALGVATLPAGLAVGSYTIQVSYSDQGGTFSDGGDTPSTLTVTGPATVTTAMSSTVPFSSGMQLVSVSATVQSPASGLTVTIGSILFSLDLGNGSTAQAIGFLTGGSATALLSLPAGLAVGSYRLTATYMPAGSPASFTSSSDSSHSVIVEAPPAPTSSTVGPVSGFNVGLSFFGVTVQPTLADGSAGPSLFLSIFQFPFPIVSGVTVDSSGNFDVHLSGLFFGFFPISIDVFFTPSGSFINFAIP